LKNFSKSGGSLFDIVKKNSLNKKIKKIKKTIVSVIVQKARFFVIKIPLCMMVYHDKKF
jgi:hypothetical protein